jgi:serine/threonine-protein kinase
MAPEQATGDAVDQRTDLYAWGVLAYELLAGRHPFTGRTTAQQLIAAHVSEAPPPLSVAAPHVPKPLASLVMACLAKSPGARPSDASALLAVLEPTGERPAAIHSSRRARYVVGAALAVVVAGGVALGVPAWRQRGAVRAIAAPAITVLPFENLSGDSASTYFSDGMTEEMLGVLERARVFRVSSRATTFSYKGRHEDPVSVATKTRADAVLSGSVRRVGDQLRVVAELARGSSGEQLWTQTYDRSPSDILIIQEDIARAIASSLRITLAPRAEARRVAPASHDAYLRARQLANPLVGEITLTRQSVEQAIALLERAVADDSTFAQGWAQLGRSYVALAEYRSAPTLLAKAKQSILRAVQLDPTNADVALSHAGILLHYDWNWEASEREYRRALALDPLSAQAHREFSVFLSALRRSDEAIREMARADTLEWGQAADTSGLRATQLSLMAHTLAMAGRTAEARRLFEEALRLAPTDVGIKVGAGFWLPTLGDPARAVQELEIVRKQFGDRMPSIAFLGIAYAAVGRQDSTRRILADIERRSRTEYFPKDQISGLYFALGDSVRGLRALEQAIDEHHWWAPHLNNIGGLRVLRTDPEFRRLMKRLNVPDASL